MYFFFLESFFHQVKPKFHFFFFFTYGYKDMYVCKYTEFILQARTRTNGYYQGVTVFGSVQWKVDMPIALKSPSLSLRHFDCFSAIHDSLMTLLFICLHFKQGQCLKLYVSYLNSFISLFHNIIFIWMEYYF